MNDSNSSGYVIDADALIGLGIWHPFDLSNNFWSKLEVALKEKKVVLLDVVVDEVKYDGPPPQWFKKQKINGLITKIDDVVREKAVEISNQYKIVDENTGNSQTDTYILAYASLNNLKIFTREGLKKREADFYKIPDICQKLGIQYTRRPRVFLSHIGYREA